MRPAWDPGARIAPGWRVRRARFEDVPDLLRLIEGAIDRGCRGHYSAVQRRAVFLGYAQSLFFDVMLPFDTVVAEAAGLIVGTAQMDLREGRLRALFVDGGAQGRGYGLRLLRWAVDLARARGLARLHGAMSLNAVPFYAAAGFQPCPGNRLISHNGQTVPVQPMELAI
jgi:N-acetylglutamate synthase-like GNAT family acetyltransferase